MKKIFFYLILAIISATDSNAQYITIPDTAFANFLNAYYVTACMNGNQLDTTCPDLLNLVSLVNNMSNIKDLTGIQYFKNLQDLNFGFDTSLIFIPAWPPHLSSLEFTNTHMTTLPPLPVSLTSLNCEQNWLDSLPTLPDSIYSIMCGYNRLHNLPSLPNSLNNLVCSNNQIHILPTLPSGLYTLDCGSNLLDSLPELPATLGNLICPHNRLTSLPVLPPSLGGDLDFQYNLLTSIPALRSGINQFFCGHNYHLSCLPELGFITQFEWDSTAIQCLPDTDNIQSSFPSLSSVPLCRNSNPNGCLVTNISEISNVEGLNVYPNPTNDYLYISIPDNDNNSKQIEIANILGQVMKIMSSTDNLLKIDCSGLSVGIYVISVHTTTNSYSSKFIIN